MVGRKETAMPLRPDAATLFHRLHAEARPLLLLPNAWDAGSARLMESLGAPAVATTSAGVAWAHGWPDGDALPLALLLETLRDIARVVRVPITVDLEAGYGDSVAAVGAAVRQVVEAGAVGINIEDGTAAPEQLAARIAAARAAAEAAGVRLYINARADVYLRALKPEGERVEETLRRARLYREAGASGLFVPGLARAEEIRAVAAGTALPVNLLAWPGLAPAAELAALGARRLSAGSGICGALWGRARDLASAFLAEGRSDPLRAGAMSHAEINRLVAGG
jgi:2-methylisocitrate lyase-like PEP mutase family enzyme